MTDDTKDELDAMRLVYTTLKSLGPQAAGRVMNYVQDRLDSEETEQRVAAAEAEKAARAASKTVRSTDHA